METLAIEPYKDDLKESSLVSLGDHALTVTWEGVCLRLLTASPPN